MRLHVEMLAATRRRCAWDAEHARHLREAEALQLWNHFGYTSIIEYLERAHGIEPRTAMDRLRVSQALAELPLLEAELEEGAFSYSHVKELTRVAVPETEEEWIAAVRGKSCHEVEELVKGHRKGSGPQDPTDPDLRLRKLTLELPPQTVVMYRELRAEIEAEMGHRLDEAEVFRIMIERARVSPEGASTPAQISICEHCERGWQSGEGGRAELEPAEIDRARCDGEVMGDETRRKVATVTPKRRARVLARDQHRCTVLGCRSKRHLDVHHVEHRAEGGGHEDENLITLCSGHHRAHHRGQLAITGRAPDAIVFAWVKPDEDVCAHVGTEVMRTQARDALVGLGWKSAIASAAAAEAIASVGVGAAIDVVIREALRRCPRPSS